MRRPPLAAVILDMDGLLIDTEPVWRSAENAVFGRLGLRLSELEMAATMGMRIAEVVAHWRRQRPWPGAERGDPTDAEIAQAIVDRLIDHVDQVGGPKPGVAEVVALIRTSGLGVAIASSSPRRLIDAVCDRLDLAEITVRCSAADESRGKPAPDVYLTAARRLGTPAGRCLALEDSPLGVLSAVAAGMRCVAVPDPMVASDPRFAAADRRLGSLLEFDEACLRESGWQP